MIKHTFVALGLAAMLVGCASANSKAQLTEPEVTFTQTSVVAEVARHVTGNIPVHYQVRVANKSGEPITLTRIDVQSMGAGAYALVPQSTPFKQQIAPDHFEVVEFWVPAIIQDATVYGANGPVTLRAVAHFDSPVGQFQSVVVQQVHDTAVDDSKPH